MRAQRRQVFLESRFARLFARLMTKFRPRLVGNLGVDDELPVFRQEYDGIRLDPIDKGAFLSYTARF